MDTQWENLWDDVFTASAWGRYPPEDLIRFVARNYYAAPDRKAVRILEIGCGPGANVWYLAREGFSVSAIDGSAVAIARCAERLAAEGLAADLKVGDVNRLSDHYAADQFDAVLDIGCLVCFTAAGQRAVVEHLHRVLKPGGKLFSRLFARGTWGDGLGQEVEPGTFTAMTEGPLAGIGRVHFADMAEVQALFAGFQDVGIETSRVSYAGRSREVINWLVSATKAPA
ncbi:MAG: class I SAM-dependent methyltransferase [Rhodospirillaceae bacterium]|nr:class I SAM-dependent methyltransferase [Rhodospirillaceae bacterium]